MKLQIEQLLWASFFSMLVTDLSAQQYLQGATIYNGNAASGMNQGHAYPGTIPHTDMMYRGPIAWQPNPGRPGVSIPSQDFLRGRVTNHS